jgi:hypothetical protein
MLLRPHNPDSGVAQSSVKFCFYATPAGNLKPKGIGDTLATLALM